MRRLTMIALLLVPAAAAADVALFRTTVDVRVDDPDKKLGDTVLKELRAGASVETCWTKAGRASAKLVFDKGVAISSVASGSGDKAIDACLAQRLGAIKLSAATGPVVATFAIASVAETREQRDKRMLESLLANRDLTTSLSKFHGIKGPEVGGGTTVGGGTGSVGGGSTRPGGTCVGPGCTGPTMDVRISIGAGTGQVAGLTLEEIDRVVKSRAGIYRACYQKELNRSPGIQGRLVVTFEIDAAGVVTKVGADAGKSTLRSQPVIDCVKVNLMRLKFPAKGTASVSYPIVFSSSRP